MPWRPVIRRARLEGPHWAGSDDVAVAVSRPPRRGVACPPRAQIDRVGRRTLGSCKMGAGVATGPWPTSVLFTVKVRFGAALPHRRIQRVANLRDDKQAFWVNRRRRGNMIRTLVLHRPPLLSRSHQSVRLQYQSMVQAADSCARVRYMGNNRGFFVLLAYLVHSMLRCVSRHAF